MQNSLKKTFRGFSLVELLVAMAIIGVLLGLVVFGISTAQLNSRDAQRRQKLADFQIAITDHQGRTNAYPTFSGAPTIMTVGTTTVGLAGPTQWQATGTTAPGATSTANTTSYCYATNTTNFVYIVGAKLESGAGAWAYVGETKSGQSLPAANSATRNSACTSL